MLSQTARLIIVFTTLMLATSMYNQTYGQNKNAVKISEKNAQQESNNRITKQVSIRRLSDEVQFEFIGQQANALIIEDGYIQIDCKIHGNVNLEKGDINIYVDDQLYQAKGNVVSLLGSDKVLSYNQKLKLKPGDHSIQLCALWEGKKSCSKVIYAREKSIVAGMSFIRSEIQWITPDPIYSTGKLLYVDDVFLPVEFQIISTMAMQKEGIQYYIDGVRRSISERAVFNRYGNRYRISDQISLSNLSNATHDIVIKAVGAKENLISDILKINFNQIKPNLHLITVGTETNLDYTVKDAVDFASIFKDQGEGESLFNRVVIQQIVGDKANASEISGVIEELTYKTQHGHIKSEDVVVLFMSSHGFMMEGDFRLQGNDYDPLRKNSTSVSYREQILGPLSKLDCKKLIFIDACHSGGAKSSAPDLNAALNVLNSKLEGFAVVTSSQASEVSYEDEAWRNGAFTEAIVRGLSDRQADEDNNRIITLLELYDFLKSEIPAMVLETKNELQHPDLVRNELGDIPIYLIKSDK